MSLSGVPNIQNKWLKIIEGEKSYIIFTHQIGNNRNVFRAALAKLTHDNEFEPSPIRFFVLVKTPSFDGAAASTIECFLG